jgi:hypothetical protein
MKVKIIIFAFRILIKSGMNLKILLTIILYFGFGLIEVKAANDLDSILNSKPEDIVLSAEEKMLYSKIMSYRKQKGLSKIPLSKSLSFVARAHCLDLFNNFVMGTECNLHSWSDKGIWKPVCYTPDQKNASLMWSKPSELTDYTGNGYEIAFWKSDSVDARTALDSWINSPAHNIVILNKEIFGKLKWKALGIAIYSQYSCVWFGEEEDPVK